VAVVEARLAQVQARAEQDLQARLTAVGQVELGLLEPRPVVVLLQMVAQAVQVLTVVVAEAPAIQTELVQL
jgi:hypothetical protein